MSAAWTPGTKNLPDERGGQNGERRRWGSLLWREAKGMAGKPSAEGTSDVPHESSWSFQQTPVIKTGLPQKDLWGSLLLDSEDPLVIEGGSKVSEHIGPADT